MGRNNKLGWSKVSGTAEPGLRRSRSIGSRDCGWSDEIDRVKRFRLVQKDRALNKTPESVSVNFTSDEGDELILWALNIQHANRVCPG
jgi:hypothetical protein